MLVGTSTIGKRRVPWEYWIYAIPSDSLLLPQGQVGTTYEKWRTKVLDSRPVWSADRYAIVITHPQGARLASAYWTSLIETRICAMSYANRRGGAKFVSNEAIGATAPPPPFMNSLAAFVEQELKPALISDGILRVKAAVDKANEALNSMAILEEMRDQLLRRLDNRTTI